MYIVHVYVHPHVYVCTSYMHVFKFCQVQNVIFQLNRFLSYIGNKRVFISIGHHLSIKVSNLLKAPQKFGLFHIKPLGLLIKGKVVSDMRFSHNDFNFFGMLSFDKKKVKANLKTIFFFWLIQLRAKNSS